MFSGYFIVIGYLMSPLLCLLLFIVLQHVPKMLAFLSMTVHLVVQDGFAVFLLIVVLVPTSRPLLMGAVRSCF